MGKGDIVIERAIINPNDIQVSFWKNEKTYATTKNTSGYKILEFMQVINQISVLL